LQYLGEPGIAEASRIIDDAAQAAGRDPREVRRLLNVGPMAGGPEDWVEQLLPLVLEHGFSTFVLSGDDPGQIQRFGEEVAPALRDAVERERRAAGTETGPARGAGALARRAPGIDYEDVPAGVEAIEPGDRAYAKVRDTYVRRGAPGLVLRPSTPEQVAEALAYARRQAVPLAVRSGGHGISGRSTNDGGIVLDVGRLDAIELLDPATGRFRVGPGARWGDVAQALQPHGLAMSSGDYGDVGVGGLATAAGVGFLGRKHGLTIDHVVAAEVVLADGTLVRADAEHRPDLFWALRGAGGNFGIVTSLELEAYPVGDVVLAVMTYDASDTAAFLQRWGAAVEAAPRELTSFLHLSTARRQPIAQTYTVVATADAGAAAQALTPLLDAGPLLRQQAHQLPYAAVVPPQGLEHPAGPGPFLRAGLVDHLTPDVAGAIGRLAASGAAWLIQVRQVGGAINDVAPDATAYAHRHQNFSVSAAGHAMGTLNDRWDAEVHPHVDGLYLSFDTDTRPERLRDAFPGATLDRLRDLKAAYDPDGVFNQNFPIPPALRAAA
ncbi:MAG TPA: FAD-binding oxidoreductase, partial [Capillimicrobium sp.]